MKRFAMSVSACFLLSACTSSFAAAERFETEDYTIQADVLASGLDRPWGFAFLPDGAMLITGKGGSLRQFRDGRLSEPIQGVPAVRARGQGGLLDVAISPDFASDNSIFLTFSEYGQNGAGTSIAKAQLHGGTLNDVRVIFRQNIQSPSGHHFGSRIAFAPDGTLFFTIGDRGDGPRAQDPFDHAGSVLRINPDGSIPADNPFASSSSALPEIWSTGHRNPQGIDIDHETGTIWTVEHGARGGDEVNAPEPGKNYGWPVISYGRHYSGGKIGEGTAKEGMEQPIHYWDPSIAPSSLFLYTGELFKEWQGDLFISALRGALIARLDMQNGKAAAEEQFLHNTYGRIRQIDQGPDGAIYAITDDGLLIRLSPVEG